MNSDDSPQALYRGIKKGALLMVLIPTALTFLAFVKLYMWVTGMPIRD